MLRKKCDDCQKPQWIWRLVPVENSGVKAKLLFLCFDCMDRWFERSIEGANLIPFQRRTVCSECDGPVVTGNAGPQKCINCIDQGPKEEE